MTGEFNRRDFLKISGAELIENLKPQNESEIALRIELEIKLAQKILETGNVEEFIKNKYIVSALYYSDEFYKHKLKPQKIRDNPSRQIISKLKRFITPEIRRKYVKMLREKFFSQYPKQHSLNLNFFGLPLDEINFGKGKNHYNAVDLFARRGAAVKSVSYGVVILAEKSWTPQDPFSTASILSGNSIIIFNPFLNEFYRYCHLQNSIVKAGDIIIPGEIIGYIGRTGLNAYQPQNVTHLHFEINQYNEKDGSIKSLSSKSIKERLIKAMGRQ